MVFIFRSRTHRSTQNFWFQCNVIIFAFSESNKFWISLLAFHLSMDVHIWVDRIFWCGPQESQVEMKLIENKYRKKYWGRISGVKMFAEITLHRSCSSTFFHFYWAFQNVLPTQTGIFIVPSLYSAKVCLGNRLSCEISHVTPVDWIDTIYFWKFPRKKNIRTDWSRFSPIFSGHMCYLCRKFLVMRNVCEVISCMH